MAIYSKHQIRLIAATDGTNYKTKLIERDDEDTHEIARTDFQMCHHGYLDLTDPETYTLTLTDTQLSVIRAIYVSSSGACTVSLLDNDAAANELTTLKLGGASGTGAAQLFCEIVGFTIASSDTFVIASNGANVTVEFALFGDKD